MQSVAGSSSINHENRCLPLKVMYSPVGLATTRRDTTSVPVLPSRTAVNILTHQIFMLDPLTTLKISP